MKAFASPSVSSRSSASSGGATWGSSDDGDKDNDDPNRFRGKRTADLDNRPFFANEEDEEETTNVVDVDGADTELR